MTLVHLVIDEAAALGHHDVIDDALSMGRGYGLRVHLSYQNVAQMTRCYPDGQHQVVLGTTTNIFFAAHDAITCEEISKRSGSETVAVDSGGDGDGDTYQAPGGGGPGSVSLSRNRNRNWSLTGKPLLRPEQVAALPERIAVTFAPGVGAPVLTWLTRYYEEPAPPSRAGRTWGAVRNLTLAALLAATALALATFVTTVRVDVPGRKALRPTPRSPPAAQQPATPTSIPKARD